MSLEKKATAINALPRAKIKKYPHPVLIWIVPPIAAIVAVGLICKFARELGPLITIQFEHGNGLRANQTVIEYRGVRIGKFRSVQLAADTVQVEVQALLTASAKYLMRAGCNTWLCARRWAWVGCIICKPSFPALISKCSREADSPKKFIGAEESPIWKTSDIAFATPSITVDVASNDCAFELKIKVDEKWLPWSPIIAITNMSAAVFQSPPASFLLRQHV